MTTENRTNRLRYGELKQLPQKIGEAKSQNGLLVNDAVIVTVGSYNYFCRVQYIDDHGDAWGSIQGYFDNISDHSYRRIGHYERFLWIFWRLVKLDAAAPGAK